VCVCVCVCVCARARARLRACVRVGGGCGGFENKSPVSADENSEQECVRTHPVIMRGKWQGSSF
jgi:hypothetical protein